jgi:hypothetical protein
VLEFDEKGKFFTEVVTKDKVIAHIQTESFRVRGYVHVRRGERLSDELNQDNKFLAVTDAEIYSPVGELLYISDFLAINREHIVWLMPLEDGKQKTSQQELAHG